MIPSKIGKSVKQPAPSSIKSSAPASAGSGLEEKSPGKSLPTQPLSEQKIKPSTSHPRLKGEVALDYLVKDYQLTVASSGKYCWRVTVENRTDETLTNVQVQIQEQKNGGTRHSAVIESNSPVSFPALKQTVIERKWQRDPESKWSRFVLEHNRKEIVSLKKQLNPLSARITSLTFTGYTREGGI